ncbi:MAG: 16S rRNA (uracil(1498)-N(3))-methyltransferase [Treponema sp.]|nr:16S rRNA (uracil(1498)-N(3))-methyltransferase [Treponema sp.]
MKQLILGSKPGRDNIVRLEGDEYRYLVRVRRIKTGEKFIAITPNGDETVVQVLSIYNGVLTGKCSKPFEIKAIYTKIPEIILFQAMPKSDKMDLIVRQAAEGGITEIVPFVSEFSVAKTNAEGQKFNRWKRIIKEARQQSGSKTETFVRRPLTKNELFEYWEIIKPDATGLLFHHEGLEKESLHGYLNIIPKVVVFAIGPEGGFSNAEVSYFTENGFKPFNIGDTILRTETAALYCAAAIKILLLERDSWELKQMNLNSV